MRENTQVGETPRWYSFGFRSLTIWIQSCSLRGMCLAVPGRVLDTDDCDPAFRTGNVDFCGVRKRVSFAYTPEVVPGDFVLVHVGFALRRVDAEEAARTFQDLRQIGVLEDEGLDDPSARIC